MTPTPQPQHPAPVNAYPDSNYPTASNSPIHPLIILVVLVIGVGIVLLGSMYWLSGRAVTVILEGTRQDVRTHQGTVAGLLDELSITLGTQDTLSPSPDTTIRNGLIVEIAAARPVLIETNGHTQRILTARVQPRDILAEAGINIGPHDLIRVDGTELSPTQQSDRYTTTPSSIVIVRALQLSLDDNGQVSPLFTASRTVGEALHDAHLTLYLADSITPDPSAPLADGDTITIRRSVPVTLMVDNHQLSTRTHAQTVSAALAETGIALVGLDYVIPAEATPLRAGMTLQIVRVNVEQQIERSLIDFKRVRQDDPSLAIGAQKIIQPGIPGIREERITIRRENGVEVSRSAPDTVILQAPQDEITAVGTLPADSVTASLTTSLSELSTASSAKFAP